MLFQNSEINEAQLYSSAKILIQCIIWSWNKQIKTTHILYDTYQCMQRQNQTSDTDRYGHCTGMNIHKYNLNFCTKILVVLSHFLHTHNNTDWIYNLPLAC